MLIGFLGEVWQVIAEDFSDLPSAAQVTRVTLRILVAAALGGALGFERESVGKPAGTRTHMLIALGAALFVLIPQQLGATEADVSRVIQGLVAGVGFLGAGAILKGDTEAQVKGLTTAAGIWLTAAIGVACGLGREVTAILSAALALVILNVVPRIEARLAGKSETDAKKPRAKKREPEQ